MPPPQNRKTAEAPIEATSGPSDGGASGRVRPALGIALPGGGHRASLWALGSLFGIVDAGAHTETVSISSVSGGSIANGVLASGTDYRSASRQELEQRFAQAIQVWDRDGLCFTGSTDGDVAKLFFLLGVWRLPCSPA